MIDYLYAMAMSWPAAAVSLLLALVVGGLLWVTHNALTHFDDRVVLFEQGSVAYLVQRVAYLFRWVTNRLILRSWTLRQIQEQQRTTASAFSAVLLVVVAISVAAVVRTQL